MELPDNLEQLPICSLSVCNDPATYHVASGKRHPLFGTRFSCEQHLMEFVAWAIDKSDRAVVLRIAFQE